MRADLRVGIGRRFADEGSALVFESECEAIRAQMGTAPFVVGPREQIRTRDGRVLGPGEPIGRDDLADVVNPDGTIAVKGWQTFERLVRESRILENYNLPTPPRAA